VAVFENEGERTAQKQETHTLEASKIMEDELKSTLVVLAQDLFGQGVNFSSIISNSQLYKILTIHLSFFTICIMLHIKETCFRILFVHALLNTCIHPKVKKIK
jgi:hypothetical protein